MNEFPQLRGRLRGNPFTATRFLYDDAVSLDGKSTVVEAYYRRKRAGRTVLHYVKYVGDTVLYSTEEGEPCREALPLLGEVARSAEGVARVETRAEWKRKSRVKTKFSPPFATRSWSHWGCKGRWFGVSRAGGIASPTHM